jgi:hypothetical protein
VRGDGRGKQEVWNIEGCRDVVRQTIRPRAPSIGQMRVHRVVWLLGVTHHEDSEAHLRSIIVRFEVSAISLAAKKGCPRALGAPSRVRIGHVKHLTTAELQAGLGAIRSAPKCEGVLELIVRRPKVEEREVLHEGRLDVAEGLVGDTWRMRKSGRTADGSAHPDMQLNIMNARVAKLVAGEKSRWPLAGDQLYIDMDVSAANLPPGTRLALGTAVIEVTDQPHTGCGKFVARFGADAMKFVNSPLGRELCLRGINAKVVQPGTIRLGDVAKKLG